MSYWVNHLTGESETDYDLSKLSDLLDELNGADNEHTDVSLTHESEWALSAFKSGLIIWENVAGEGEPKHMKKIGKDKVISLWTLLADGKVSEIEEENWLSGYGN